MAAESRWTAGNHPTPHELLLAREDELPREKAGPILSHIHQCWHCRAQVERYKRGIETYLTFRELRLDPAATPRSGGWMRMSARLRCAAADSTPGKPAFGRHVPNSFWLASSVAAAGLAAALAAVLLLAPGSLTANVVFDRAARAESAGYLSPSRQRVLVRRGGQLLAVDDLVFRQAHIERSRPLSADSFREWHNSLHSKRDTVTTLEQEIRVETTSPEGVIALASLTVARTNYRPHAKHVELRDGITIDVEALAAEPTIPVTPAPTAHLTAPAAISGATEDQREALEMEVRWALHRIDADLGEPLAIRTAGDRLLVGGTVDDAQRRDQIAKTLGAFPQVTAQLSIVTPDSGLIARAQPIELGRSGAGPLLTARLRQDLPDADVRRAFVSGALESSHEILRHCWALRRLADRYPSPVESALGPDTRTSLRTLVETHRDAIRAAANEAAVRWRPYMALDSPPGNAQTTWQAAALTSLSSAQALDHCSLRLLAAGGADGLTVAGALEQLAAYHQRLLSALPKEKQ